MVMLLAPKKTQAPKPAPNKHHDNKPEDGAPQGAKDSSSKPKAPPAPKPSESTAVGGK
jgi:hypothetical protein